MSRSCPRVASPSPGRSTLITSAPNQASSCVHVGPDCTCVKSRMRTPDRALLIACLQGCSSRGCRGRGQLCLELGQALAQCTVFVEATALVADHRGDRLELAVG